MNINEAAFWTEAEKYTDIRENNLEKYIDVVTIIAKEIRYTNINAILENVSYEHLLSLYNEISYCNDGEYPEMVYGAPRATFALDEHYFNGRFPNHLWNQLRKKSTFL